MTAPAHQGVQTAGDSNGSTLAFTRATTTTNNVNILDLYIETAGTISGNVTFNNGTWVIMTASGNNTILQTGTAPDYQHVRYYEIYAGAGASCTATFSGVIGSVWRTACINGYSGVNTTTPEDVAGTGAASAGSSASATAPGFTTVTGDVMVIICETDNNGRNTTPPTGTTPTFTERTDFGNMGYSDGVLATAQTIGDKTVTVAAGGDFNTVIMSALRPSVPPAAGGSLPIKAHHNRVIRRRRF